MTLPRTDAFSALTGTLPTDGAAWIIGDLIASDKTDDEYGELSRYGARDFGTIWTSASVAARAWHAWRESAAAADQEISGRFFWRHVSAAAQDVRVGLMARLQSITSTASGPPERWYEADAYVLEAEIDVSAATATLYLRRYDQGVATDLASESGYAWPENRNYELSLSAETLGDGRVRLRASVDGDLVVEAIDAAVTALAGAGHFGWLTSSGKAAGGETRASLRHFEAATLTGTVWLRDEFDRPNRIGDDAAYYLRSLWNPPEAVVTSGDAVSYGSETDVARVSLAQIRPYSADYTAQADVTYPNGSDAHWIGICARASKGTATGDLDSFTGYLARLRIDDSTDNLEVLKYVGGTLIETVTASVSGLSASTPIELKIDVSGSATVSVKAYVDASLEATLTDTAADRLTQSGQSGVYVFRPTGSSGALVLDDFVLGDGAAPSTSVTCKAVQDEGVAGTTRYFVENGDLSDQIDGVVQIFSLDEEPEDDARVWVEHNGYRLERVTSGANVLQFVSNASASQITLGATPAAGDTLRYGCTITGNTDYLIDDVLTGTKDGVNKTFLLPESAADPTQVRLFWEGYRLQYTPGLGPGATQFTVRGTGTFYNRIVIVGTAPASGDRLTADYVKDGASVLLPVFGETPTGAVDGSNRSFELSRPPNSLSECKPHVGGFPLEPTTGTPNASQFSLVGRTVTMGYGPAVGTIVVVDSVPAAAFEVVLPYEPDYPLPASAQYHTSETPFEYGYVAVRPLASRSRRRFEFVYSGKTEAERDALIAFFAARTGPYQQFAWKAPGDTYAAAWQFEGEIQAIKEAPDVYTLRAAAREMVVFAAEAA